MISLLTSGVHTGADCDSVCITDLYAGRITGLMSLQSEEYALKALSSPPVGKQDILYRQAISQDFLSNPDTFYALRDFLYCMAEKGENIDRLRLSSVRMGTNKYYSSSDTGYRETFNYLVSCAELAEKYLTAFSGIRSVFSGFAPRSEGLTLLINSFNERLLSDSFIGFRNTVGEISRLRLTDNVFDIDMSFDERLSPASLHMTKATASDIQPGKRKKGDKLFQQQDIIIEHTGTTQRELNTLFGFSVRELSSIISNTVKAMTTELKELWNELSFYEIALKLADIADRRGESLIFPVITDGETECEELKDPFLIIATNRTVIGNNLKLTERCPVTLIKGLNNSGKTVYLRSVGLAQLFGQSGLPVFAKSARIRPVSGIYTLFSGAEEGETLGAGRFETEAAHLAEIIGKVTPGSLLLLNEAFQSTSYEEGAEALDGILRALAECRVRCVTVTHLLSLFDTSDREATEMLTTTDNYKLIRI